MELALQVDMFLPPETEAPVGGELEADGFRFRLPTSRDLAALLDHSEADAAATHLLERCCVVRPDGAAASSLHGLLEKIEAGLEALDPSADIELSVVCGSCEHAWSAPFDIAACFGTRWRPAPARCLGQCTPWRAPMAGASATCSRSASSVARPIWTW